jgi:hypothetical protein
MRIDNTRFGDAMMSIFVTIWCVAILRRCIKICSVHYNVLKSARSQFIYFAYHNYMESFCNCLPIGTYIHTPSAFR